MIQRRTLLVGAGAWALMTSSLALGRASTVLTNDIELPTADPQRTLPLRLIHPEGQGPLPVVIFSHGAYSSGRLYDPILSAWAAAGFAVFAPTHRDSTALGVQRGANDPRYFGWRLDDMEHLQRSLKLASNGVPGLADRLQLSQLIVTGHSFGGLVAQTLAGATYFDVASSKTIDRRMSDAVAAIIFSGAGRFSPLLRTEDFSSLQLPLLVTVGTNDLKQSPDLTGFQWRREPFDLAASRKRYLLTLQGCDHYLGGLVGRDDLPRAAQAGAWLQAFNQVSIRFLRAAVANRRGDWLRARSDKVASIEKPAPRLR